MSFFDNIKNAYTKKLPFVAYRKPNSKLIAGFFQKNDALLFVKNYTESGFVFAPFDDKNNAILIPKNQSYFIEEEIQYDDSFDDKSKIKKHPPIKDYYIKLIEKAIANICKGAFKKIVVSREESIRILDFDIIKIYQRLLNKYPSAFVYIWFHPKVGLWFGATPEILLKMNALSFKTTSLAGTQVYKKTAKVIWKSKEIKEQQLVTEFIKTQLTPITTTLKIRKTKTIRAGNLLHLKTKISGTLNSEKTTLQPLIRALHPTPAVCGLPRNTSKKFILANENYQRTFYTGFLGTLNTKGSKSEIKNASLFVNLRCMKIENGYAKIYIGGGITKESDAEREWEETVFKSNTIKNIL